VRHENSIEKVQQEYSSSPRKKPLLSALLSQMSANKIFSVSIPDEKKNLQLLLSLNIPAMAAREVPAD